MKEILKTIKDRELEASFDSIRELVTSLRERTEKAEARVAEWNKDDEVQRIQDEINELRTQMNNGFNPSEEQWKEIHEWESKHIEKHHAHERPSAPKKMVQGAAQFEYKFSYTPIGILFSVECQACRGKNEDYQSSVYEI